MRASTWRRHGSGSRAAAAARHPRAVRIPPAVGPALRDGAGPARPDGACLTCHAGERLLCYTCARARPVPT